MNWPLHSRSKTDTVYGISSILLVLFACLMFPHALMAQQIMVTISPGAAGDPFNAPQSLVLDSAGNIFVSDTGNHRVQRIDKDTGAVTTVAGTGTSGSSGDGGLATLAQLNCPEGLAFDKAGNLYIADYCANFVRKVAPGSDGLIKGDGDAGEIISVFAGDGSNEACSPVDDVPANQTSMGAPFALAIDSNGNMFVITGCELIRMVDGSTGIVTTTSYRADSSSDSLVGDSLGDLLIASYNGVDIVSPDPGHTLADGGKIDRAFNTPDNLGGYFFAPGMAFDKSGNLFLTNYGNCNNLNVCHMNIFELKPGPDGWIGSTGTTFSTYAGTGQLGYSGDGGDPLNATMEQPWGLAVNSANNLFFVDQGNNVIRGVMNGIPTDGTASINPPTQTGDPSPVFVTFNGGVTKPGSTVVVAGQTAPALPSGFQLGGKPAAFFDVITTAEYTAPLTVCFNENPVPAGATLQHFNSATNMWEDKTVKPVPVNGPICAVVDSLSPFALMMPIPQNVAPTITSANSATFQVGVAGAFTVTATGSPAPAITQADALPNGMHFVDNGDGTGTLSGIPAAGTAGQYSLSWSADNGVGTAAVQSFTLTVVQAPAITSVNNVTFTESVLDSFTVTSTGFPIPALTETGALPNGIHFVDNGDGTGTLSGTATVSGTFNFSLIANNGIGGSANQSFTLSIPAKLQLIMVTASRGAPGDPFNGPESVVFDKAGNIFVSDTGNHRVQRIDKDTGAVTTVAGTGTAGGTNPSTGNALLTGNGGPASAAQLGCPAQMTFDSKGNLYISDACQHVVWKVAAGTDGVITGANDEIISNYAGNGSVAGCNNDGPSGVATQTGIDGPSGLAMDKADNLWILAQGSCVNVIRRVDAASGLLTTTNFYNDWRSSSIIFDSAGDLIIDDEIYPLPTGQTIFTGNEPWNDPSTTVVGFPNLFDTPSDLALDTAGNLYGSFSGEDIVYKAVPNSGGFASGATTALYAGTKNSQGYIGDGSDPLAALMNQPQGIAANAAGNLFIADTGNNVIRAVVGGATTGTGSSISVNPLDQNGAPRTDITLTFDNITATGATTVVVGPTGPALPAGFQLATTPPEFFDIVTTAQFTGSIKVCVNPAPAGSQLLHFVNGLQDSSATLASGSGVCISVTSLSPFALVKPVVQNQALAITSASSATFQTGVAAAFTITTSGSPTAAISASGPLPSGVSFTDHGDGTATLSGPPAAGTGGTYAISLTATNGVNPDAHQSFVLTVDQAPAITSANAATFTVGSAGSFTATATGYPAPQFSETGALPNGVMLNSATGALGGTPAAGTGGVYPLTLIASNGISPSAQQSFVLTVNQAPAITSANGATFQLNTLGSFTVTSTGYPVAALAESGALPSGVNFADNGHGTGTISGTPTVSGVFNIAIMASNGVGSGATQNFTLTVPGGSSGVMVSPASINFGSLDLFHFAERTVTITNTGSGKLAISKISMTPGPGSDRDDFPYLSTCKPTLAPGKSCEIYVYFFADHAGTSTGTLGIFDNATGSPQQVSLTGSTIRKALKR